jgi:hypothetical protein
MKFGRNDSMVRRVVAFAGSRRGVASVLSMMFLILFGSLAAAMAIASRGNIKTAATNLHMARAAGAAETGLAIAKARLQEAASRFIVAKSNIDSTFASKVWTGDTSSLGTVSRLSAPSGYSESSSPAGVVQALANHHAADQNIMTGVTVAQPTIASAPAWASSDTFGDAGWLITPAVGLENRTTGSMTSPLGYSIVYAPLANGTDVRVYSTGYDYNETRNGDPVKRTISMDFRIAKRLDQAILAPCTVQIGSRVSVAGDIGVAYSDVNQTAGNPLVMKSDFYGLDASLDAALNSFAALLKTNDADLNNRLRLSNATESADIPPSKSTDDFNKDGTLGDGPFTDADGDGMLDDFDLFLNRFDKNKDGKVVLSAALTTGTPSQGVAAEFTLDDDLAYNIDNAFPDRNKNSISGFTDTNGNGVWDSDERAADVTLDSNGNVLAERDRVLGWRDGTIDKRDQYAKLRGKLVFKVSQSAWKTAQGDLGAKIQGAIRPENNATAVTFGADTNDLPVVSSDSFVDSEAELRTASDGRPFWNQVGDQVGRSDLAADPFVVSTAVVNGTKKYTPLQPDGYTGDTPDGLPKNWQTAYWEPMPVGASTVTDYYYRPVFENMTFKDVTIPMGLNALFKNCTFAGVTYIKTTGSNTHVLFGEYGKMQIDSGTGRPKPAVVRYGYGLSSGQTDYPDNVLPSSAIPPSVPYILMATDPTKSLDKADVSKAAQTSLSGWSNLPSPLVIDGKRITDTRTVSNNIRFDSCLFVGSIVSDKPSGFTQQRNKIQFTGSTRILSKHPEQPDDASLNPEAQDQTAIKKSSMMLPNYSVDVGYFNSPATQNVQLKGAIVAGVLDIRGNATVDGVLMLTFAPVLGQGPLRDSQGNPIGNPASFNSTIGYFGSADGDSESVDPATLQTVGGVKIVGWDLGPNYDGFPDLGSWDTPTAAQFAAGAVSIPFNGYGRTQIRFDPTLVLPDGILLPLRIDSVKGTYREGEPW